MGVGFVSNSHAELFKVHHMPVWQWVYFPRTLVWGGLNLLTWQEECGLEWLAICDMKMSVIHDRGIPVVYPVTLPRPYPSCSVCHATTVYTMIRNYGIMQTMDIMIIMHVANILYTVFMSILHTRKNINMYEHTYSAMNYNSKKHNPDKTSRTYLRSSVSN